LLAATLASLLFVVPAGVAHANPAKLTAQKQVSERLLELTIDTPAFTEPTKVHVFLPTGYDADPSRRWPVTYALAGMQNNYNSFANVLDGVNLTKDFPSIVVSPDGNSGYWSDWYNGGKGGPPEYETYVIEQLLPLIDANFRTIPDRAHRAVVGISMGGYGSMMLAAHHPDLFGSAATISGAVDSNNPLIASVISIAPTLDGGSADAINGPRATQEVRWHANNPTDIASNLRGMDIQVRTANGVLNPSIGEGDNPADIVSCVVEAGVYQGTLSFNSKLNELGIDHLWKDYGNGCHTPENFTRETVDTLAVFSRNFAHPAPDPQTFEYRSIKPEFDIWGWHVKTDPNRATEFMQIAGGSNEVTLTGTGRTSVTSPALYKGLKKVDVDGKPVTPAADGRLRFTIDLGRAHTDQQYTLGADDSFEAATARFKPHALIRILKAKRVKRGVRVCAKTIGGVVPRARIKVGKRTIRMKLTERKSCRNVKVRKRPKKVTAKGSDTYGHPARSGRKVSRKG
jgi:S-formylglutathione hydrolase FrmB